MNQPSSLKEWQDMFQTIYGDKNQGRSLDILWLMTVAKLRGVVKALRKENYELLAIKLPELFAWICAFANKLGVDLEDTVFAKFPRVCPYCLSTENCICLGNPTKEVITNQRTPIKGINLRKGCLIVEGVIRFIHSSLVFLIDKHGRTQHSVQLIF